MTKTTFSQSIGRAAAAAVAIMAAAAAGGHGAVASERDHTSPKANHISVSTRQGPAQGVLRDGVAEFFGNPYAAPPVGDPRWRPPAAPANHGLIDATLNLDQTTGLPRELNAEETRLSDQLIGFWTNCADRGNPNGKGEGIWPAFTADRPVFLRQDIPLSVMDEPTLTATYGGDFWLKLLQPG